MAKNDVCTILGVFKNYGSAQEAARRLADSGIPQDSIQIQSESKTQAAGSTAEPESQGGFSGWLRRVFGSGMPDDEAEQYRHVLSGGGALVCVSADGNNLDRAVDILEASGAIDVEEQSAGAASNRTAPAQESQTIPVIEEQLKVGKRAVRRGGVRVYSRMVEEPVEEDITLREERVQVQRRPVDRPVTAGDESAGETIDVVETVEEPVISKQRRVKEEVVVGRETTERKEKVRDTVKHTEVQVEPAGEITAPADYDADFRRDYQSHYAPSGVTYATLQPAYEYGYRMAANPRYKGRPWSDVESQLETDYLRQYPNSTWDKMRGAVRYGWQRVRGEG